MKKIIGFVLILISLTTLGYRIYIKLTFDRQFKSYIYRASEANTIDIAKTELAKAVKYLEVNNLTSGYTSIFIEDPNEDIGFLYSNLKASLNELEGLKSESALEKSNVLLKLRETLITSKGKANFPKGLAVYPNNLIWGIGMIIALIGLFVGWILMIPEKQWSRETLEK